MPGIGPDLRGSGTATIGGPIAALAALLIGCGPGAIDLGDAPPPCDAEPSERIGFNAYHLLRAELGLARGDKDDALDEALIAGAGMIRTWAFDDPRPEGWTDALVRVLDAGHERGLRFVLTLSNRWSDYGGAPAYLDRAGLDREDMHAFFTSPAVEADWRARAEQVVDATRGHPAIFAWELMNEPRCPYCDPSVIRDWIRRQANHLGMSVLTGEEGWSAGDGHGVDFAANTALQEVWAASFHLYPRNQAPASAAEAIAVGRARIAQLAARARDLGKPAFLGEVGWAFHGCPATDPDCSRAREHLETNDLQKAAALRPLLAQARREGLEGVFVWRLAEPGQPDWDHYSITPSLMPHTTGVLCEAARARSPG